MCILRHHFIKYLCKLKFQVFSCYPDRLRPSFAKLCVLVVSDYLQDNRQGIYVRLPLTEDSGLPLNSTTWFYGTRKQNKNQKVKPNKND